MEREDYPDERLIRMPSGWNRHHLFWERRHYRHGFERNFRNLAGLVVPTPIQNHNLLHARLEPPRKPNHRMMVDLKDQLNNAPPAIQMDRLWGALIAEEYFRQVAETLPSPEMADLAHDLSEHMSRQIGYLSLKLVSRVA